MKIAFCYDVAYPWVVGGAERRYYEIGRRLAKKHEVHQFCMQFWKGLPVIRREGMVYHGVCKAQKIHAGQRRSITQAIWYALALFWPLMRADFDLLDASNMSYFQLFTCKLVCILKRKKMYVTWHEVWGRKYWQDYLGSMGYAAALVERLTVLTADEIISVSPLTTDRLRRILKAKKNIIYCTNGIDVARIHRVRPSRRKYDIIFIGRLQKHKNVDVLLHALARVSTKRRTTCIIIGDGPERERLIRLSNKLMLNALVKFLPFQDNQDTTYAYMKSANCLVLPSTREGFGIVVAEAFSCGLPVITSNAKNNAARQLVNDNNGYILNKLNPNTLSDVILTALMKGKLKEYSGSFQNDWGAIVRKYQEAVLHANIVSL